MAETAVRMSTAGARQLVDSCKQWILYGPQIDQVLEYANDAAKEDKAGVLGPKEIKAAAFRVYQEEYNDRRTREGREAAEQVFNALIATKPLQEVVTAVEQEIADIEGNKSRMATHRDLGFLSYLRTAKATIEFARQ